MNDVNIFIDLIEWAIGGVILVLTIIYNWLISFFSYITMFGYTIFQLVIAFLIALIIFAVLWKVLKVAIRTAIVFVLLIFGLYLAVGIIRIQFPGLI